MPKFGYSIDFNAMRAIPIVLLMFLALSCGSSDQNDSTEADSAENTFQEQQSSIPGGSEVFQTCIACHGANGEGNQLLKAPMLVNQEAWYLKRQLQNFKNGIRGTDEKDPLGVQMAAIAMTLNEQSIDAVISHISELPQKLPSKTLEGDVIAGKQYYNMICGACHGPGAEGNQALNAPGLSGTDDWYLFSQYQNFAEQIRGTHPKDKFGMQMQMMSNTLPNESALLNVIAYIQSLQK